MFFLQNKLQYFLIGWIPHQVSKLGRMRRISLMPEKLQLNFIVEIPISLNLYIETIRHNKVMHTPTFYGNQKIPQFIRQLKRSPKGSHEELEDAWREKCIQQANLSVHFGAIQSLSSISSMQDVFGEYELAIICHQDSTHTTYIYIYTYKQTQTYTYNMYIIYIYTYI